MQEVFIVDVFFRYNSVKMKSEIRYDANSQIPSFFQSFVVRKYLRINFEELLHHIFTMLSPNTVKFDALLSFSHYYFFKVR